LKRIDEYCKAMRGSSEKDKRREAAVIENNATND